MLNYNWFILGDMFRPLNVQLRTPLFNIIVPSWPEDGRLVAETCRQV